VKQLTLSECCYQTADIKAAVNKFADFLNKTGELTNISRANNLRQYYNLISKKIYMDRMEKIINRINKDFMRKYFPDVQFKIELRIKSLLSFDTKLQLLQKEAAQDIEQGKRPRELFPRDVMAFRIIILDRRDNKGVDDCFRIMNALLPFLVANLECILQPSSGTVNTVGFEHSKHPEVIFPSGDISISDEFKMYVKNYVETPKTNGYQALHSVVMETSLNFYFEIQIETQTMFYNSTQTASHEGHKSVKYADIYDKEDEFDPSRVNMPGFFYYPDTDILYDYIGLVTPRIFRPFTAVNI
jgi:(p)ppGpp synthase/HD superfamily hydrolase